MKVYGAIVASLALVLAVAAAPNPDVSPDTNIGDVDIVIRQQSADFLKDIYAATSQPQPDGSLEVLEELVAASVPEPIRQEVANELETSDDGTLSDDLKERINYHILEWSLQYVPDDLQRDITAVLETYRTTGQVSDDSELLERVRQYVASLETGGRNKRGFWSGLFKPVLKYVINFFLNR
uniref:Putative conserved secreted protein n=1 Tax=Aedes albopictus TaxID=7160 RepID=A0A1W7R729_AEDAL